MKPCPSCGVRYFAARLDQPRCSSCQAAWDARTAADERRAQQSTRFSRARVWTVAA